MAYRRAPGTSYPRGPHALFKTGPGTDGLEPDERPHLMLALVARLEGDFADLYCLNPNLRSSALRHWRARINMPTSLAARLPDRCQRARRSALSPIRERLADGGEGPLSPMAARTGRSTPEMRLRIESTAHIQHRHKQL